jgi:hypothetical protein
MATRFTTGGNQLPYACPDVALGLSDNATHLCLGSRHNGDSATCAAARRRSPATAEEGGPHRHKPPVIAERHRAWRASRVRMIRSRRCRSWASPTRKTSSTWVQTCRRQHKHPGRQITSATSYRPSTWSPPDLSYRRCLMRAVQDTTLHDKPWSRAAAATDPAPALGIRGRLPGRASCFARYERVVEGRTRPTARQSRAGEVPDNAKAYRHRGAAQVLLCLSAQLRPGVPCHPWRRSSRIAVLGQVRRITERFHNAAGPARMREGSARSSAPKPKAS